MSAHDRYLARYQHYVTDAWCANPACANHRDPIIVDYEEEYGAGWTQPEECPVCHSGLTLDAPEDGDDE